MAGADAVLAVTPEYNGTMPAVLNNAIDWLSRPYGACAITGKRFGVVGATPTQYGGKWAHEDARRSATIAGAQVVDAALVSQSALEVDVLNDPQIVSRFTAALHSLCGLPRRGLILSPGPSGRAPRRRGRRRGARPRPARHAARHG